MSYILDALTRSQKQRERALIPTLTTDYVIDGKSREPYLSWQWLAVGLASIVIAVGLYSIPNRSLELLVQHGDPSRESSAPRTVNERSIHQSSAEVSATDTTSFSFQSARDITEPNAKKPIRADARDISAQVSPTAVHSSSRPPAQTTTLVSHSPAGEVEQGLKPESRRLVNELLALRQQAEQAAQAVPRAQASTETPPDMSADRGSDANRRVDESRKSPSDSAPARAPVAIPTLRELPPEVQAALPPLEINVHAYSQSSDQRMVIINMKTYGEGDRLREGPVIDAITPTGVVLVFKDRRFKLAAR